MHNAFTLKDALSYGWKKLTEHFWFFVLLSLAFGVVQAVLNKLGHDGSVVTIARLADLFVSFFAMFTFVRIGLKVWHGHKPFWNDIFSFEWPELGVYILGALLFTLMYAVGFALVLIPGIIVLIRFGFFGFIIVEEKLKPVDAFKRSWALTTGHFWHLLGIAAVLCLINLVGAIALGLGLLVTAPLCLLATVYVYEKLKVAPVVVAVPAPTV